MLFKLPYNFEFQLLEEYENLFNNSKYNMKKEEVLSIYLPCFREDGCCTRKDSAEKVETWDEYVWHIKYIKSFGYNINVLFQGDHDVEDEVIYRYLNLGITHFTVSNISLAQRLKILCPEAYLTASIVKVLAPEQIHNDEELQIFDEICLFFWYNREFDVIKQLPKRYRYQLLAGSLCDPCCKNCFTHWNMSEREAAEKNWHCPWGYNPLMILKSCWLDRGTVEKFLPNEIYSLKLHGREYSTPKIIENLKNLCGNSHYSLTEKDFNLHNPFPKPLKSLNLTSSYYKQ